MQSRSRHFSPELSRAGTRARRWNAFRRGARLWFVASLLTVTGCAVSPLDLTSKQCPCAEGWTCDTRVGLCSRTSPLQDAGERVEERVEATEQEAGVVAADARPDEEAQPEDQAAPPLEIPGDSSGGEPALDASIVTAKEGDDVMDASVAPEDAAVAEADSGSETSETKDAGMAPACAKPLLATERLYRGEYRCSRDGVYRFGMSTEGDLELRRGDVLVWSAGTCCGVHVAMQRDGNLVVRSSSAAALFATNTLSSSAFLSVEVDGRAVIWEDGRVLWSTAQL